MQLKSILLVLAPLILLIISTSSCLQTQKKYQQLVETHKQLQDSVKQANALIALLNDDLALKSDSVNHYARLLDSIRNLKIAYGGDSIKLSALIDSFDLSKSQIKGADPIAQKEAELKGMRAFIQGVLQSPVARIPFSVPMFNNRFDVYVVDIQKNDLQFFWQNDRSQIYRSLDNLKKDVDAHKKRLLFATNGGMYTPENKPQGLYVEKGRTISPLIRQKEGYGNFFLQPNGVFFIDENGKAGAMATAAFDTLSKPTLYATQSGPMLVIDGKRHPAFNKGSKNKYIRSGVGVISPAKIAFVISRKPVNFYDFSTLFKDFLGCQNALYLDGAISRMYLPELDRQQLGGNFGPLIGIVE